MCACWCCRVQSTVQLDRVRLQRPSLKWLLVQLHPCPLSDSGFWLPLLLCTAVSSRYADARLRCTGFLRRLISCSSYVVCCGFSGSTAQKAQHCFPAHTTSLYKAPVILWFNFDQEGTASGLHIESGCV